MTLWIMPGRKSSAKAATASPSGWEDTTAAADNLAARIRNTTFVPAGGADFVTLPMDAVIGVINFALLPNEPAPADEAEAARPARYRKYQLADLMDGFEPKNRHSETDWGKPAGNEVW